MVLFTINFHYSNNLDKLINQIFVFYDIIATCFWLVNQESDLRLCLHSKYQIIALFSFIEISTDGFKRSS